MKYQEVRKLPKPLWPNIKRKNPSDTVEELVLYNTEVPLLDLELMTAGRELQAGKAFTDLAPDVQKKIKCL